MIQQQYIFGAILASLVGLFLSYARRMKTQGRAIGQTPIRANDTTGATTHSPLENGGSSDVIIVGAGVAGSALAYALGKDGRSVHVIERDFTEPNRMVGEFLQPGGYLKLVDLGLEDCVEKIDAQHMLGYVLYMDGRQAELTYPLDDYNSDVAGRSFHNGRFVQRLREKAASIPNVRMEQGTVTSLIKQDEIVKGVLYKKRNGEESAAYASLTVVCDGYFSNLRRSLCDSKVDVLSHYAAWIMERCELPSANYTHIILADPSPILLYHISSTETRCFIAVPGRRAPSTANGELQHHLKTVVAPQIPQQMYDAFMSSIGEAKIRLMPHFRMETVPLPTPGAFLLGDALNTRHALTAGGMTVALSDVVVLRELLRHLHDLTDSYALSQHLMSFYTLRKPMAVTINTMSRVSEALFCFRPNAVRMEARQACFDYFSLGGPFARGPVNLLGGLDPHLWRIVLVFFSINLYGIGRLLLPYPSPKSLYLAAKMLRSASSLILATVRADGIRKKPALPSAAPLSFESYVDRSQEIPLTDQAEEGT